jgi:hypothetical protein
MITLLSKVRTSHCCSFPSHGGARPEAFCVRVERTWFRGSNEKRMIDSLFKRIATHVLIRGRRGSGGDPPEARPCVYELYRRLIAHGFDSWVCAASLIPRKPGERVKNATLNLQDICDGNLLSRCSSSGAQSQNAAYAWSARRLINASTNTSIRSGRVREPGTITLTGSGLGRNGCRISCSAPLSR